MKFNKYQTKAVNIKNGNWCVIASAGSGKTAVLSTRIVKLIASDVDPRDILAITFTKGGADNMIDRIKNQFGVFNLPTISTCHALGLSIIKRFIPRQLHGGMTTPYWEKCTINNICTKELGLFRKDENVPTIAIKEWIDWQKIHLKTPMDNFDGILGLGIRLSAYELVDIYQRYEKVKAQEKMYDFTDMLYKAWVLLQDEESIRDMYRNRFKYVLVDEAQDCNLLQIEIIKLINQENVFFVGDHSQSIFGFAGSYPEFILNFDQYFSGGKYLNLPINYRCSKDIVDLSNRLISNADESKHKFYIEAEAIKPNLKEPIFTIYDDDLSESTHIVNTIIQKKNSGEYDYKDFAILMRINAQSRSHEIALIKNRVPYEIVGGEEFYERKEVRDLIDFLKVINNDDPKAFLNIFNVPNRYLGRDFISNLVKFAESKGISVVEALRGYSRICEWKHQQGVNDLLNIVHTLKKKAISHNVSSMLGEIINLLNYETYIMNEYNDSNRIHNVKALVQQSQSHNTIEAFLKEIHDIKEIKRKMKESHDGNTVKVMTVHKSKGLEFPVVFVGCLNNGLFPHERAEIDEERRLAYVAITRAEKELYLSSTSRYNGEEYITSDFIEEMRLKATKT